MPNQKSSFIPISLLIIASILIISTNGVEEKKEETISSGNSSVDKDDEDSEPDFTDYNGRENTSDPFVLQMYFFEDKFQDMLEMMGREASGKFSLEMFASYNLSSECLVSFGFFIDALNDFEPWALRMLDSSSKIPEGIMYGSISSFGKSPL